MMLILFSVEPKLTNEVRLCGITDRWHGRNEKPGSTRLARRVASANVDAFLRVIKSSDAHNAPCAPSGAVLAKLLA